MRAVWHVHANQPGRTGLASRPTPPFEASGQASRRRVGAVFAGLFERGAAQAADDRAVFDLLGRELDAAWLGQARALDRRPPPAPLGGSAAWNASWNGQR